MKTLFLMRHTKSDWDQPELEDFERPLSKRGLEDAPRMGKALAKLGVVPDRIVSSPARRSRQTAELLARASGWTGKIVLDANLYASPGDAWLRAFRGLPDDAGSGLIVAHSPGCDEAAVLLLGAKAAAAFRFPTGAVLCVDAEIERWSRLRSGHATLRWFLAPKVVKAL